MKMKNKENIPDYQGYNQIYRVTHHWCVIQILLEIIGARVEKPYCMAYYFWNIS